MFSILVAADIFGTKLNYEVTFNAPPSVSELRNRIMHVFGQEISVRKPPAVPHAQFVIERLQVFDEKAELWVDLGTASQLTMLCQVYAFQPESTYHKEVQSKLPPATRPPVVTSHVGATPSQMVSISPVQPSVALLHETAPLPSVSAIAAGLPQRESASTHPILSLPSIVPHGDKVKLLFDEIDVRKSGSAYIADFTSFLKTLAIETSGSHCDFFQKADPSSLVSFPEFQRFSERYPTLLEAIFSRCREFWIETRQREDIHSATAIFETLSQREGDVQLQAIQATADTNFYEQRVQEAIAEKDFKEAEEREATARVQAAQQESVRCTNEISIRAADVAKSTEKCKAAEVDHFEASRGVEQTETNLRAQDFETQRSEEKVRELEQLLQDAHVELEQKRHLSNIRRSELTESQTREQFCMSNRLESDRLSTHCIEQLNTAQNSLARAQELEREMEALQQVSKSNTLRSMANVDASDSELALAREREARKRVEIAESQHAVGEQVGVIQTLKISLEDSAANRKRMEYEEQPLIDQEIRLRAQRDCLESQEMQLRTQHSDFQHRNETRLLRPLIPHSPVAGSVGISLM